ncbi:MAG: MBOAT family protein, partial [Gammaproteobacteria bacterium]|nr:MBOAT family protein [Gammaproteobacteria bacterium]
MTRSTSLQNGLLLLASLIFYAWGETFYVLLMLASIIVNYVFGYTLNCVRRAWLSRVVLLVAMGFNLGILGIYKYANFIVDNLSSFMQFAGLPGVELAPVHLPIGISFFTFQAV